MSLIEWKRVFVFIFCSCKWQFWLELICWQVADDISVCACDFEARGGGIAAAERYDAREMDKTARKNSQLKGRHTPVAGCRM